MIKTFTCKYTEDEFWQLEHIKNTSGLSWDRFVAKAIREYGENHGSDK